MKKQTQKQKRSPQKHTYLFVVGGVMSGVGKGIASSSIAKLLQARGLTVTALKIDPYINVDAGTMNPTEHGEVFVLQNGLETDQDMGNYERFLNTNIPDINYMTTGSVYLDVIKRERNLEYGGKNVEVVPDIPLEVIRRIKNAAAHAHADVTITEIGGTVGEYQNVLFLEAVRMMKSEMPDRVAVVMVSYLPVPGSIGEMKTKPTQTAVRMLNSAGVFADFILARGPVPLDKKRKEKIAQFCNVKPEHVISAPDVSSVYDVPLNFEKDNLSARICEVLGVSCSKHADLATWQRFVERSKNGKGVVKIAVVGKYFSSGDFILSDVYLSVLEAIKYSAYALNLTPQIEYVSSRDFEDIKQLKKLRAYDGVLIPGGFGSTGIQGKINVIEYIRKHNIPFFGICYGMQLAVLEYAQHVLKLKNASTAEIDSRADHLVIDVMPDQKEKIARGEMGGSMRLGDYPAVLKKGSIVARAYGAREITERHRHRYEVNPQYVSALTEKGVVFSGTSPDGSLMEIMELPHQTHPFFVGVQFHPEFHARPLSPHPLFTAFVKASYESARTQ
ncbi:MAG TPA: CTP synthase [Candidatus Paceibacterota bacterium]|nr:CTP synthase [Candidatus Paceibacterota bacterium]